LDVVDAEDLRRQLYLARDLWSTEMHCILRRGHGEPQFRLAYMPMRNRCEVARLILEEAGAPYDFEVIGFKRWWAVKEQTPFGKVPILRALGGAGDDLAQEGAITRFLARKLGLAGRTVEEEAAVDMVYQQLFCTLRNNGLTHDGEHYSPVALRAAPGRAGPAYREMHRLNNCTRAERSLAALDVFEERLARTGTGVLVGDAVTYADLALFYILYELAEEDNVPDFAERFRFPRLGEFLRAMAGRPRLKAYVESPRRMPRYERPGYVYCPGRGSPRPAGAAEAA